MSDYGQSFDHYIAGERDRLARRRSELYGELDTIDAEFRAIEAYQQAKLGASQASPARRTSRGRRQQQIIDAVTGGGGLTRGEILERLGLKGSKRGEGSVSNALTAIMNKHLLIRDSGRYYLPEEAPADHWQQGNVGSPL